MTKIAVVIPSYNVRTTILDVIKKIGPEVSRIYVVDDCCPENSGDYVEKNVQDIRVSVIRNAKNLGVGGAVVNGYFRAIADDCDVVVKIDGDNQMDPSLLIDFVTPIILGEADYTKGNRFYDLEHINRMPKLRLIGNSILSFVNKISSGYWNIFDPTNGYTAIHSEIIKKISFNRVSKRYFFESDMLFRLNILKAVVVDVPMAANYGDEKSGLRIYKVAGEFLYKNIRNFAKRVFYNYYLRDMSVASLELPLGLGSIIFGLMYAAIKWHYFGSMGAQTPLGTVMIASLALLFGLQFLLAFLAYDINSVPRRPIHHIKSVDLKKLIASQ